MQSPYIIYHKKNNIFGLVNGDVIFSTFPDSNISKQKIKKSNLISINCNDRQQLLSIGRASNILNYTYLWKDNLKFKIPVSYNVINNQFSRCLCMENMNKIIVKKC